MNCAAPMDWRYFCRRMFAWGAESPFGLRFQQPVELERFLDVAVQPHTPGCHDCHWVQPACHQLCEIGARNADLEIRCQMIFLGRAAKPAAPVAPVGVECMCLTQGL